MIIITVILFPIVTIVNGEVKHDWLKAVLFSLSVAVGLLPSMLPAIVNANIARGAFALAKKNSIVKCLDSVQDLGTMTVICSNKTTTLTKDEISLHHYLDPLGDESTEVYRLAYTNTKAQGGKKNGIDSAILKHSAGQNLDELEDIIGEVPFNFETRRSSCITRDRTGRTMSIVKGAYEDVIARCSSIRLGAVLTLDEEKRQNLTRKVQDLNPEGYRVILVTTRDISEIECNIDNFEGLNISMTVQGLLTFLDPPKDNAKASIARLQELGVEVRCLTGDNVGAALKVCRDLNIVKKIDGESIQAITGPDLALLEGADEFHSVVKHCKIFTKLTPSQKGLVIDSLKRNSGHVVGMLGDGINDCIALCSADVGVSVHTGQNVAKDCADIILTEKELSILVDCVVRGRTTQGNTIKYIKMGFSSNFANVISILISSCWLPFEPLTSLQIFVSNLLYDISQLTIPLDDVDAGYLATPQTVRRVVFSTTAVIAVGVAVPFMGPIAQALDFVKPENTFWGFFAAEMVVYVLAVEVVKWAYIKLFKRW
ncbi:hypothetical protein G7Y89_g11998 [Cudoniella acicularis]|uniref:Cation-transporting P-type ATPase C-terminal domain-containing protein n=1 Tax=Cudoniella acicularis TaxID=354080 RepID=A0A8H4VXC6_9HELO|nr:hypothetical protein G7Y89_g11998 [Cudoniella acicularis]